MLVVHSISLTYRNRKKNICEEIIIYNNNNNTVKRRKVELTQKYIKIKYIKGGHVNMQKELNTSKCKC